MADSYDVRQMIEIARMNANSAASVGSALIAEFNAHKSKLGGNVVAAGKLVVAANETLKASLLVAFDPSGDPSYMAESRAEAAAWSAFAAWLEGCCKLHIPKKAAMAAAMKASLLPTGLTFLRKPAYQRYSETESRLAHIKENKLDAEIALLGGADFLSGVRETHKVLGEAAGITGPASAPVKSGVGLAFDGWKAAVRCYIAQVVANQSLAVLTAEGADADKQIEAANALAKALLEPLTSFVAPAAPKTDKTKPVDGDPADPAKKAAPETEPAKAKTATK